MNSQKRRFEWPEHTSWWDRNEKKINILLWLALFVLVIIARELTIKGIFNLKIIAIWTVLFFLDLFILSFLTGR